MLVKRLYTKGTIEERILTTLAKKRRLFTDVVDENRPDGAMGLTEEELFSLFNLKVRPRKRTTSTGTPRVVLDNMNDRQFETLVAMAYEKEGFEVKQIGGPHDGGIDIIAERGKDRIIIQCKHQMANIGRPVIQQLWGVLTGDHSFTQGHVVTSGGFTRHAMEFAAGKRLTLVDRAAIEDQVRRLGVAQFVAATE